NQNYAPEDHGSQSYSASSYPEQDYRPREPSAHDRYSDHGYEEPSDQRYDDRREYRALDGLQHISGQQHYDEHARFEQQNYSDQSYGNFAADPQGRYDRSYAQDSADDYQDTRYQGQGYPPIGDEGYDDAARSRRRGGMITIVAVLALATLGTAGAFAYRSYFGGTGTAPPVIRADAGPNKVVPATQSGDATSKLQ